jgi:hypothetical protein
MKPGPLKNLCIAAAVLVLLAIITSPVLAIWMIRQEADHIVSDPLQGLATSSLASMQMAEGFLETARAVNGNGTTAEKLEAELKESSGIVDAHYATHQATLRTEKERTAFDQLTTRKNEYRATRHAVVSFLKEGKAQEADALFESECVPKFQAYAGALGDMVKHNAAEARSGGERIIRLCHILLTIQALLLLFFFVYGFFVPLTAVLERLSRNPIVVRK